MIRVQESSADKRQRALVRSLKTSCDISKAKQSLSEADVTRQICDFLRARGWILKRQQSGLFQRPGSTARVRIGEVGEADWMAVKPTPYVPDGAGLCVVFYFEVKALHKIPSFDQCVWLETRRRLGFEADWFDSLEMFTAWYSPRFA